MQLLIQQIGLRQHAFTSLLNDNYHLYLHRALEYWRS